MWLSSLHYEDFLLLKHVLKILPIPGSAISLDCEGIFLTDDAGFWISDEYGPYVYQFDHDGKMLQAIRPPDAILPLRKGVVNFSANSPPRYDPNLKPSPGNPTQGRQNNQGESNVE